MNFKTISAILTILTLDLLVLSSPIEKKKCFVKVPKNSVNKIDISQTIPQTNPQTIPENVNIMDITEVTDSSSDDEPELIIDVEKVTEIETELETEFVTEIETVIDDDDENVCNTKECIDVSNNIINNMDESVNPCEDFYQFTCGNYIKNNPVNGINILLKAFDKPESYISM
ncbi:hypothetical protein PIROE2DRAFT_17517 [Piromyces sp. E2]|nr:hypothetical protein PIROE2DRAFT_17517 [Piromyces sp. E2]|eukprot:OUM57488.1 hypothetical protein PIROE2DRAFT_17517 [Piromyces sp. E2]